MQRSGLGIRLLVPDVLKINDLARLKAGAGALSLATGGDPARSPRYQAVLEPMGVRDELRAVLSVDGVYWGWLALFRLGSGPFTQRDVDTVARVTPHLPHAWRGALLHTMAGLERVHHPPAVVVLDRDDRVVSVTPAGRVLLDALPLGRGGPLADVLHALAVATRSGARGDLLPVDAPTPATSPAPIPAPTSTRVTVPRTDGSWVVLEAAPLIGVEDQVVVTLRPAGRTELSTILLSSHGLTPRETEVALAALGTDTNAEIARSLFLSTYTVQDHLRSILTKTGARSRRELAARLLTAPRQSTSRAGDAASALGLRATPLR